MKELLQNIEAACTQYLSEELDDAGFQKVIDEIPMEIWQEKDSALTIVKTLVENEDLYEVSLKKPGIFAEFICRLLPQTFRENPDYVLSTAEIIADFMDENCEGASSGDLDAVFSCMPQTPWEDNAFATAAANIVIERAYAMYDLNSISEIIPESVWENENELCWLVRSIYNADERNMSTLCLFPEKAWESPKVIDEIFSCFQIAIENDRDWGTAYGNFRGSNEEHLERFLYNVPEKFKSDKELVLNLLGYDYFYDAFHVIYDWIDQSLWFDKDFVMEVMEKDSDAALRVPDVIASDEKFRAYIDENVDLDWIVRGVPEEKIPLWIKNWVE